jgi:SAM-dependent methyltransferase
MLKRFLEHPLTRGMDVDDPLTTDLRRQIVKTKPFLRKLYEEWYLLIRSRLPLVDGFVVELGSGAGFMAEYVDELITSDVHTSTYVQRIIDARKLPFDANSLKSIVMVDVLHHIPEVEKFFAEALRTLKDGGRIIMIEPWVTAWSKIIYTYIHHEPFNPDSSNWDIPDKGPLSGSNNALPWIVFSRDFDRFADYYPEFELKEVNVISPLCFLLSGGVSYKTFQPGWSYDFWRALENFAGSITSKIGLFALIVLEKRSNK